MTPLDIAAGVLALVLLLYFLDRRQKSAYHHELTRIGMAKSRADELVKQLESLTARTVELESTLAEGEERRNSALKTFLESWAELIKVNEDQKKNLINRLQAKKLDQK